MLMRAVLLHKSSRCEGSYCSLKSNPIHQTKQLKRMILSDNMLSLAFDVRDARPWELLDDSCIFALHLSSGEIGYVCIMGHAGEHFAIGLYVGQRGFTSYLKSLQIDNPSMLESMEEAMSLDYINCDFENADALEPDVKKRIRAFAEAHKRKIRRPKGWPDFIRHSPYKPLLPITRIEDEQAITEALQATLALTLKLRETSDEVLGFDPNREYPTKKGGKQVPLLTPNADRGFDFGMTTLPPLLKENYPSVVFDNEILSYSVSALPVGGEMSCKYFHVPQAVALQDDEDAALMPIMLCVNEEDGMVEPVMTSEEELPSLTLLLTHLAQMFLSMKERPSAIYVNEKRTQALLADFCRCCDIKLTLSNDLHHLEEASEMLYMQFSMLYGGV